MEAVLPHPYTHNETAVVLLRDQTLRQRQTIDERRELRNQRAIHGSDCAHRRRPRGAPLASVDYCMKYYIRIALRGHNRVRSRMAENRNAPQFEPSSGSGRRIWVSVDWSGGGDTI